MTHGALTWDDPKWDRLLTELATGKRGLSRICRDADMPGHSTVYDRIAKDEVFAGHFRAHKAIGVRAIVDDCLEIADESADDAVMVADKRVRIDTRLRLAGKWLAAEFGDKLALGGADDLPAMKHDVDVSGLSEAALREIAGLK